MPRPTDNPDHPENREQAVLELLRELQAGGPPRDEAADPAKSTAPQVPEQVHQQIKQPIHQQRSIPVAFLLPPSEVPTERVSCNSCGWENPADHSFCSMCGELLANHAAPDPRIADSIRAESSHRDPSLPPTHVESDPLPLERSVEGQVEDQVEGQIEDQVESQVGDQIEYRAHRNVNDDRPRPVPHLAPASSSYRVYIIAALAILTVVVIVSLMAGRGRQPTPESSKSTPQAPPAAPRQTTVPSPDASSDIAPAPAPAGARQTRQTARSAAIAAEKNPATPPKPANGAEELAIAQSYLNGTDGREHNSEEGVQWLWKAVAKRNADATFRLADLYLKGEGVPKNCEQARVLLDAAARKGIKDAAQRLLHLQSFDCE